MRPNILSNATKVLIAAFALILSFTDFAMARDRGGDRHSIRRSHHERQHRPRDTFSGFTARHHYHRHDHHDRRQGRNLLASRSAHRRYFDPGYGFDRRYRFDRRHGSRVAVREFNRQGRTYWEPAYGGDDFPSATMAGTYFGGLSAWSDPGNGTYFNSEGSGYGYYGGNTDEEYRAPPAKIIRVDPSTAGRACSWESGVCVIRR